MDIKARISSFDFETPDWHLIDVLRGCYFSNIISNDVDFTVKMNAVKRFVECNVVAREIAHKKVFEVCGKMVQEKFVEISREETITLYNAD